MKFDPISNRLYTDEKVLLKQLHCPYGMSWDSLQTTGDGAVRLCDVCERSIIDTAGLRDDELLAIVRVNPSTCLRVSLNQDNLRVIYDGP